MVDGVTHDPCNWFVGYNLNFEEWETYCGIVAPYRPTCRNLNSDETPFSGDPLFHTLAGHLLLLVGAIFLLGLVGLVLWRS
jgi:hypothetical protein